MSQSLHFCNECSNIMRPIQEDKTLAFICRHCSNKQLMTDMQAEEDYLISKKDIRTEKKQILLDPQYATDPTMARTRDVRCPSCKFNEAVYFLTTDLEDTKIVRVYICARTANGRPVCGHHWYSDQVIVE